MKWIEWKGEEVGDLHHTVCLCVYSYIDDGPPVIGIIPRAFCWFTRCNGERYWSFFEGDNCTPRYLNMVKRGGEFHNIYQPERGDKIFYSIPTLPDGRAFNLNYIKRTQLYGLAVVVADTNLVQPTTQQEADKEDDKCQ